jgi:NIPSNAP
MSAPVLDLRTYRLVPGGRDEFDRIFRDGALPMLETRAIEVVGYGPSLADERHYFLARAFPSEAERQRQLESFYSSEEWRRSYADRVNALIETYHHLVLPPEPLASRWSDAADA